MIEVRQLYQSEVGRIEQIDRSEHVTLGYLFRDGRLAAEEVDWRVPRWPPDGDWGVEARVAQSKTVLENGGVMIGALEGDLLVGYAILRHRLTEGMAQLWALFVSKDYRRSGLAARLTAEIARLAKEGGATKLYVSATPSESAVGFYQSQGFQVAKKPHPELYALEPEDIHMIKAL